MANCCSGSLFDGTAIQIAEDADSLEYRKSLQNSLGYYFLSDLTKYEPELVADDSKRLRIDLSFHENVQDLSRYPWEFLYVNGPEGGFFLAGQKTHLILNPSIAQADTEIAPDAGAAGGVGGVGAAKAARPLAGHRTSGGEDQRKAWRRDVAIKELKDVTLGDFEHAIDEVVDKKAPAPHIIHFIGHGQIANGKNQLAFQLAPKEITDAKNIAVSEARNPAKVGEYNWVDADTIHTLIEKSPPRLFFLHSCNTGRVGPGVPSVPGLEAFRGAAQQIANSGVSFVIAMQYAIENEDAKQFTRAFYEGIGKGQTVDEAVTSGRDLLGQLKPKWGHRRFGTPVVFMRTQSQALMRPRIEQNLTGTTETVDCPYCTKQVRRDETRCRCELKKGYRLCGNGHACMIDDTTCPKLGCGLPLTPLAAPSPTSVLEGAAETPQPSGPRTRDLGFA